MPAWKRSKHCTKPCKCQHCTTDMKTRATSGYRNSSLATLKTFLTQSFSTLLGKSTRGTSDREQWSEAAPRSLFDFYDAQINYLSLFQRGFARDKALTEQHDTKRAVMFRNRSSSLWTLQRVVDIWLWTSSNSLSLLFHVIYLLNPAHNVQRLHWRISWM